MSSSYHTPRLLHTGVTRDGLPFRVCESQLTGNMLMAYDFELMRKMHELKATQRLRSHKEPTKIGAYHKLRVIK